MKSGRTHRYHKEDIPALVAMAQKVIPSLPNYSGVTVNKRFTELKLGNNVGNDNFYILVLCDSHDKIIGAIMAIALQTMFSFDVVCMDRFLYIEPGEYRNRGNVRKLIKGYIEWARERKPLQIIASHTSGYRSPAMDRLLQQEGFVPVGMIYHWRDKSETAK